MEKQLRRYLLPNILAMIGTSCYILADTFFISLSQGPNGITALNLVLPLYGLIFALGSMIGIGSATRYALGKGSNTADYHLYFSNSIIWTLLVGAVFVALGVAVPDGVLRLMGADDTISRVGHNYIRIVLCFAPPIHAQLHLYRLCTQRRRPPHRHGRHPPQRSVQHPL